MSNAEVLGRFVWHELMTTDTAAAAAFYPKVVQWRTAPSSMPGYTIWMAGQTQIGGLMQLPAESSGTPPHWLVYVGSPNVDGTCSHAQGLGARVVKSPADIPNVGRFAVLADPQGATFALFAAAGSAPPPGAPPSLGGFSWHELATTDAAGALRFYGELFGWRRGPAHDMGGNMGSYQIFEHAGKQVGGMHVVQSPSTPPSWLSYVHVGDASRAVAAAKAAGGRLLHGPMQVPGGSSIALFMDPQGGAFAVHELPRAAATQAKPAVKVAAPRPAAAPAAAKPAAPAAAAVAKVASAVKVAKKMKKRAKKKTARKAARKVRRGGRRVARKARRTGRRVARKARRAGRKARRTTRRVGRKARRAGRRTARRVRSRGRGR
jgi:uncharacterized protein